MSPGPAAHWEASYAGTPADEVSWFEQSPETSLAMIERANVDPAATAVIDVGGGASRLAGELVRRGYRDVTVADLSPAALEAAKAKLGAGANEIAWLEADAREHDFGRRFDLWHDRAAFHFMVDQADRSAYLANLRRSLCAGGHLVLATFGPAGPTSCSGLPVHRYDAAEMSDLLGPEFEWVADEIKVHRTPRGTEQQFQYALFRRLGDGH